MERRKEGGGRERRRKEIKGKWTWGSIGRRGRRGGGKNGRKKTEFQRKGDVKKSEIGCAECLKSYGGKITQKKNVQKTLNCWITDQLAWPRYWPNEINALEVKWNEQEISCYPIAHTCASRHLEKLLSKEEWYVFVKFVTVMFSFLLPATCWYEKSAR